MDWETSSLFNSPATGASDILLTPMVNWSIQTSVHVEEQHLIEPLEDEIERTYLELQPVGAVSLVEQKLDLSIVESEDGLLGEPHVKPEEPEVQIPLLQMIDDILSSNYLDPIPDVVGAEVLDGVAAGAEGEEQQRPEIVDWREQPPLGLPRLEFPVQQITDNDNAVDNTDLSPILWDENFDVTFNSTIFNDVVASLQLVDDQLFHSPSHCNPDQCTIPSHNLFIGNDRFKPYYDTILYCLTLSSHKNIADLHEPASLICLKCNGTEPTTVYDAMIHVKTSHNKLIRKMPNLFRMKQYLKNKIIENNTINLFCQICNVSLGSALNYVIHYACYHSSADCRMSICPFCMTPLFKESIFSHFNSKHRTNCCNEKILELRQYLDHLFSEKHFIETIKLISPENLKLYYQLTSRKIPNIYWNSCSKIMFFPDNMLINPTVPALYSTDFYKTVSDLSNLNSLFYLSLCMNQYVSDLKEKVAARWGNIKLDLANLRDAAILDSWADLCRAMWSGSFVTVYNAYDREVSQNGAGVACVTCQDDTDHRNSPELCVRVSEISPKFIRLAQIVDHMHSKRFKWSEIAALWIANSKNPLGKKSPKSGRFPVLNLSYFNADMNFPCYIVDGVEKALGKDGKLSTKFPNLNKYLNTICSVLPKNCNIPIFVEYCVNPTVFDEKEIVAQAIAFVNMLVILREKFGLCFVILGPHPYSSLEVTRENYEKEKNRLLVTTNILSLVSATVNITVLHTISTVCIYEKLNQMGVEYTIENIESFIFNANKTPTRTFVHKLTRLYEDFMQTYVNAITNTAFKKYVLQNKRSQERNYHFDFSAVPDII